MAMTTFRKITRKDGEFCLFIACLPGLSLVARVRSELIAFYPQSAFRRAALEQNAGAVIFSSRQEPCMSV